MLLPFFAKERAAVTCTFRVSFFLFDPGNMYYNAELWFGNDNLWWSKYVFSNMPTYTHHWAQRSFLIMPLIEVHTCRVQHHRKTRIKLRFSCSNLSPSNSNCKEVFITCRLRFHSLERRGRLSARDARHPDRRLSVMEM